MEEDKHEDTKHEAHKHAEHKQYMEHHEHKRHKAFETATWTLGVVSLILAIALIFAIATHGFSGSTSSSGKQLSPQEIEAKTTSYLKDLLPGQTVSVTDVKDVGDLYAIKLNVAGRPYDSYARKDGTFLFPSGIDMSQPAPSPSQQNAQPQQPENIPKSDKPKVELFVMAYCPYGTQAEKGLLPAVRALGDKVDFKVRFVYYAMHGKQEVDENLRQYCIQSEQPAKYNSYLACFLNASDSPGCLKSTGVDESALATCVAANDAKFNVTKNYNDQASWLSGRFPLFSTDAALNEKYGVQGSPTLVINGVQSSAGRDPASYLKAICGAYNNAPAECQTQLSSTASGPGFGYDTSASATAAGCGV